MPLLFIALPVAAIVVLNLAFKWVDEKIALWSAIIISIVQIGISALDAGMCLETGSMINSQYLSRISIDYLSAVVLLTIGLISFVALVVAKTSVNRDMFNFANIILLIMAGMNGLSMVTDLFSLYVFVEITSAASFILIGMNKGRDELEGAFKYYMLSAIATVLMLTSIAFLFMYAGDTGFASVGKYISGTAGRFPYGILIAFVLYTAGLLIKSGVVPFHAWVPDASTPHPPLPFRSCLPAS